MFGVLERRVLERTGVKVRHSEKAAGLMDIFSSLGWWGIAGILIGIAIFVFFIVLKPRLDANAYATDLQTIVQGLDAYYSAYHKYPVGSGWDWNANYAYVPADQIQRGWQYSCQDATITVISPPITDAKVLELVKAKATTLCNAVDVQDNRVICQLYNKPCY